MTAVLRIATDRDAEAILAIYAPIVRETPISFELETPTLDEMRERIVRTLAQLPWLVIEEDSRVLAYAYASTHRDRPAYQWSVDVSVYAAPQARRRGYARRLYTALLALLRQQGYYTAFAGIALPNAASIGLHEALGFKLVGVFQKPGYKLGAWRDVGWWALPLREYDASPLLPKKFPELDARELRTIGISST